MRLASEPVERTCRAPGNFRTTPVVVTFRAADFVVAAFLAATFFAPVVRAEVFFAVRAADFTVLPTALFEVVVFFAPVLAVALTVPRPLTVRVPTVFLAEVVFFATAAFFATVVLRLVPTELRVDLVAPLVETPLRAALVLVFTVEARFAEPVVREALALAAMNLFP